MAMNIKPEGIAGGSRGSSSSNGPQLSDYGKRAFTNDLTKEEVKAQNKWRAKNDPLEYKHEQAMKKAAKVQGTQPNHSVTEVDRKTGKSK